MTAKERERAFLIGAPLAIIGALVFLLMLPVCALAGYTGVFLALMTLKL